MSSIDLTPCPLQHFFVPTNRFRKRLLFIAKAALLGRGSESLVGDVFQYFAFDAFYFAVPLLVACYLSL
jgi:hypothetical protein